MVGSQFPSYPTGCLTHSLARPRAAVIQQVGSPLCHPLVGQFDTCPMPDCHVGMAATCD
jgi:hypothetical protein